MVHLIRLALGLLLLLMFCTIAFGASKFAYTGFVLAGGLVALFCYALGFVIQDLWKLRKRDGRFNL